MKRQFKCHQCGKLNEFDTEEVKRFESRITEAYDPNRRNNIIAYILECQFCGAENRIKV